MTFVWFLRTRNNSRAELCEKSVENGFMVKAWYERSVGKCPSKKNVPVWKIFHVLIFQNKHVKNILKLRITKRKIFHIKKYLKAPKISQHKTSQIKIFPVKICFSFFVIFFINLIYRLNNKYFSYWDIFHTGLFSCGIFFNRPQYGAPFVTTWTFTKIKSDKLSLTVKNRPKCAVEPWFERIMSNRN